MMKKIINKLNLSSINLTLIIIIKMITDLIIKIWIKISMNLH